MKILIEVSDEVSEQLFDLAKKKGWTRKYYINWYLTYHTGMAMKRAIARNGKRKF